MDESNSFLLMNLIMQSNEKYSNRATNVLNLYFLCYTHKFRGEMLHVNVHVNILLSTILNYNSADTLYLYYFKCIRNQTSENKHVS